jgi:hypothetical protein
MVSLPALLRRNAASFENSVALEKRNLGFGRLGLGPKLLMKLKVLPLG